MPLTLESDSVKRGYHLVRVFQTKEGVVAGVEYTEKEIVRRSEQVTLSDALIVAGIIKYHEARDEEFTTMLIVYPEGTVT